MDLVATFLGTAASVPSAARNTAGTLVARGGARWLIDCGEGTQRQLLRSGLGLVDLDMVLVTHLHGDHVLGLPGLLKTFGLRGRETPLRLVGPPGLRALLTTLHPVVGRLPYRLETHEVGGPEAVWYAEGAALRAFPTRHSVPSFGYALTEEARPGEFDLAAARALGVPEGPLFGRLQRGETITLADGATVTPSQVLGPPRAGRSIVVTGDTEPCDETVEAARDASLLIHEATFSEDERERARETRHSTAAEAAGVAARAEVELLALTHLSSRVSPRAIRAEAEAVFAQVVVPRDFDQIEVPFPERGGPLVHRVRSVRGNPVAASAVAADEPATLLDDDL